MAKSNLKDLIEKAKPDRLKEIEAAFKSGLATSWSADELSEARAYLDRLQLSLEREIRKDIEKPLKVAPFNGFARVLPRGTTLTEIASILENTKAEAVVSGRKYCIPKLRVIISMRIIETLSYFYQYGKADNQANWQVTGRQAFPVRVRSVFC